MVFYHGTDQKVLTLSDLERTNLKKAAITVIEYFAPIYKSEGFKFEGSCPERKVEEEDHRIFLKEKLGSIYSKVINAYTIGVKCINSSLFQYDSFYVTGDFIKASCDYAQKARYFGEIGSVAYYLLQGAILLNYNFKGPDLPYIELELLWAFWNKEATPIVIEIDNIKCEELRKENGDPINYRIDDILVNCSYRLIRNEIRLESFKKTGVQILK